MALRNSLTALLLLLCACSESDQDPAAKGATLAALEGSVRVGVAPVERLVVLPPGEATGVVTAFRKATVSAEVAGRVLRRLVEPGIAVERGQVLVELDAQRAGLAVQQARAELQARTVRLAQAEQDLTRGLRLFERGAISQDTVDDFAFAVELAAADLQAAEAALATAKRGERDTRVLAPFSGTAEIVHVQVGDYVNPGSPVATLADFSKARVSAGVTGAEAGAITPGQSALVSFGSLGGVPVSGTVHSVGRIADPLSGTYAVEVWVEGGNAKKLREGMVGTLNVSMQTAEPQAAVPRAALFRQGGRMHVFAVRDGVAELVAVSIGRGNQSHVEILAGLAPGDVVVVEGQFALRDGVPVQVN